MGAETATARTFTLAARVATAGLAVLVGWTAWEGYRSWTAPPPAPAVASRVAGAAASVTAPPVGGPDIAALHLFGRVAAAPDATRALAPAEAPETRLNVQLLGVLSSPDPVAARAIIASAGSPEKHYQVGDRLPAGAAIAEIRSDSVLLERNGRFETLRLRRDEHGVTAAVEPGGASGRPSPAPRFRPPGRPERD